MTRHAVKERANESAMEALQDSAKLLVNDTVSIIWQSGVHTVVLGDEHNLPSHLISRNRDGRLFRFVLGHSMLGSSSGKKANPLTIPCPL